MIVLAVHVTIQSGHEDEVAEGFRMLESESRKEPGCLFYMVQRSRENSRRYLVYEQYKDDAALEAHRNSLHFKKYATDGVYRFVAERQAELFNPIS